MRPATATPGPACADDFRPLAETARRALGCDATIVRVAGEVVATDGLEPYESDDDWAAILRADAIFDGEVLGGIYALQRAEVPFENADLIETYATQLALKLAVCARRERPGWPAPALDRLALDRIALSMTCLRDLSEALDELLSPMFGGALTGIMVTDEQHMLQLAPGGLGASDEAAASHRMTRFHARSNSARIISTQLPYLSNSASDDSSLLLDFVHFFGLKRILGVPLRDVGVLHVANADHEFGLEDLALAEAIAPQVANIVELTMRMLQQRHQQRIAETLSKVALAVASGEPMTAVVPSTLRELAEITDANLLALVPYEGEPIIARRGCPPADIEAAVFDEADDAPGMRAYVVASRGAGDPGWAAFYQPVSVAGTPLGTLAAMRTRGEPFTRADRNAFARLVNTTALAYANDRYNRQRADVARLAERQRIADDLHDDVAQLLFAAQMSLDDILADPRVDSDLASRVARARGLVIRGDATIRRAINELSSPPAGDLRSRLASMIAAVESEFLTEPALELSARAVEATHRMDDDALNAVVKVAREALVNAAKHARGSEVTVSLTVAGRNRIRVAVVDAGPGIHSEGNGRHGLASMRAAVEERGGTLKVSSPPAGGTRVEATFAVRPKQRLDSEPGHSAKRAASPVLI